MFGTLQRSLQAIRHWYEVTIEDLPWVRAGGISAPLAGTAYYLNTKLPGEIRVDLTQANTYVVFACSIFVIYLLLVAVFYNNKLITERKLRTAEESFRYDHRGTLYNGTQPNIAFRVATFRRILEGFGSIVDDKSMRGALFNTGKNSALDFAQSLPRIYDDNIQRHKGGNRWTDLTFPEKLSKWAEYDSSTGWGILGAKLEAHQVAVSVTHFSGLFARPPHFPANRPSYFGDFLAGYCETVVSEIVKTEKGGSFRGFSGVRCSNAVQGNDDTVVFWFQLA